MGYFLLHRQGLEEVHGQVGLNNKFLLMSKQSKSLLHFFFSEGGRVVFSFHELERNICRRSVPGLERGEGCWRLSTTLYVWLSLSVTLCHKE